MPPDALHGHVVTRHFATGTVKDFRDVRTAYSLLVAHQVEHVNQGHAVRREEARIVRVVRVHDWVDDFTGVEPTRIAGRLNPGVNFSCPRAY